MLARLKRLIEPRSRADVVRLAIAYSVVAAALSALCTLMLALINHWPLFAPIATAIAIPLLVAPWMFLIVGNVVFRLYQAQKELEQLVRTDPLTGALNRRGTQELMTRTFEQRHDDARFCAIILDIDNFKAINDRYGHAGGDAVIVHVADVMRMAFDHEGFQIVRFGGDELGVLMPACRSRKPPSPPNICAPPSSGRRSFMAISASWSPPASASPSCCPRTKIPTI